jgi:polar amino acid transport system substrate-binding protein
MCGWHYEPRLTHRLKGFHVASRLGRGAASITAAGLALSLAACGSSSSSTKPSASASASTPADSSITVPAAIKSKGTLTVATDASYAPNEFIGDDNKTITGMDIDLVNAIGDTLGLKVDVKNATFDSIIPGLASGRYDLSVSSFTDSKEREKTVNFVTYFIAGTSLMVKKGNPDGLAPDALCGKKVAAEKGTTQADDDIPARSKTCTTAGKAAITPLIFPDQSAANLALSSGRAQGVLGDSPVIEYQVKQSEDAFELSGTSYDTAPYGIAIPKDNDLSEPVLAAVKKLMADGKYTEILKKWGLEDGAITDPKINGATS